MSREDVYMDYNATTPLHPAVTRALIESFSMYGNASSMHTPGREARAKIEESREAVAAFIGAGPEEIIFTGGGSESNNTVLKLMTCTDSDCRRCPATRREIITSAIEHPSVLNTIRILRGRGITCHIIGVDETGKIDLREFEEKISDKTGLVSIMMANNEIGTIQDIKAISRIAREHGTLVHTDAVQALGKVPVDARELDVDFMSFSGHKLYGPKGIGGLYTRRGSPYCTLIHGGHQEDGRRAGTLNTTGIIGLGAAVEAAVDFEAEAKREAELRDMLLCGIEASIPDISVNGHPTDTLPGTLNVSFAGAEGEAILLYLDMEGIYVSTGSACASGSLDPSHVLLATGMDAELAHGSIRFSLGRENTQEDVAYVLEKLPEVIQRIRSMSTVYADSKRKAGTIS